MGRELLVSLVTGTLVGPAVLVGAVLPLGSEGASGARALERRRWRRLWWPLLAAALVIAWVVGWGWTEPEHAEAAPWPLAAAALPFFAIWIRAGVRALCALRTPRGDAPAAATLGLLRPRIAMSPEFLRRLDPAAREAVWAHEEAHRGSRDPLRIWLAQLATDLQWPSRGASRRLAEWRDALELACDEDARRAGARGEDLAAALLAGARPKSAGWAGGWAHAALAREGVLLERRVRRLLLPLSVDAVSEERARWGAGAAALLTLIGVCATLGVLYGEPVVRCLLRIAA